MVHGREDVDGGRRDAVGHRPDVTHLGDDRLHSVARGEHPTVLAEQARERRHGRRARTTAGATLCVSASNASSSAVGEGRLRPAKATLTPITWSRHHSGTAATAPWLAGCDAGRWPSRTPL